MRDAIVMLLASLALLAGLEGLVRAMYAVRNAAAEVVLLPYTAAQDWGPVPPWLDGLRILEPDPVLLWRNRPGVERRYLDVYAPAQREVDRLALLQRFWPRVPAALRDHPTWSVAIGSHGFRMDEFEVRKPEGTLRIVCLGDSWTFGANVDQRDTYPQRLADLLAEARPGARVEVLNLGVMGYSSRQGLELLRRRVLALEPDVVSIGFAMNDSVVAGWHDADAVGGRAAGRPWLDKLETLRLARYLVERVRHRPWTIGDYLARVADTAGSEDELWTGRQAVTFAPEESLERLARVPPGSYEANLREMIREVREREGAVVLLYNDLWDTPYRRAVARVAAAENLPWIDTWSLLDAERRRRERALALRFGLQPAGAAAPGVVFRVHEGDHSVPRALYVAGSHSALGAGVPNRVPLHDDGRHGDERAGDGVWSLAVPIEPGERVFYVYTNSGREGRWEGLDVPDLRHQEVSSPGYLPVEHFGRLELQADGWHTDASGYEMLARAVGEILEPRFPGFSRDSPASGATSVW